MARGLGPVIHCRACWRLVDYAVRAIVENNEVQIVTKTPTWKALFLVLFLALTPDASSVRPPLSG
jgi:DMSO/TMAO reductase YedYZ heme-binding membrane subunit